MFFQKKLDKTFEALKEKNAKDKKEKDIDKSKYTEENDILAMILSAYKVFLPIFLFLIIALLILMKNIL